MSCPSCPLIQLGLFLIVAYKDLEVYFQARYWSIPRGNS